MPTQRAYLLIHFRDSITGSAGTLVEGKEFRSFHESETFLLTNFDKSIPLDQKLDELFKCRKQKIKSPLELIIDQKSYAPMQLNQPDSMNV